MKLLVLFLMLACDAMMVSGINLFWLPPRSVQREWMLERRQERWQRCYDSKFTQYRHMGPDNKDIWIDQGVPMESKQLCQRLCCRTSCVGFLWYYIDEDEGGRKQLNDHTKTLLELYPGFPRCQIITLPNTFCNLNDPRTQLNVTSASTSEYRYTKWYWYTYYYELDQNTRDALQFDTYKNEAC